MCDDLFRDSHNLSNRWISRPRIATSGNVPFDLPILVYILVEGPIERVVVCPMESQCIFTAKNCRVVMATLNIPRPMYERGGAELWLTRESGNSDGLLASCLLSGLSSRKCHY
jgi:hypothetical protein